MIQSLINKLHNARQTISALKESEKKWDAIIKQTPLYATYDSVRAMRLDWDKDAQAIREDLESECLAMYQIDGEKSVLGIISINEKPVVQPYDLVCAVEWCKANAPIALTIDRALFEDMCLKGLVPWVEVKQVARVTKIASDLSVVATVEVSDAAHD